MSIYVTWKYGDNGIFKSGMPVDLYDPKDWGHSESQEAVHFSPWHRTVYWVTKHEDSEKAKLLSYLEQNGDVERSGQIAFTEMATKISDPDFKSKLAGPNPYPITDAKNIGFIDKDIKLASKDPTGDIDFNTVSTGTFTWGTAGDYATLVAALADVINLTGDLTFNELSSITETARAIMTAKDLGGFTLTIDNLSPSNGDVTTGYMHTHNHTQNGIVMSTVTNGTIHLNNLHVIRAQSTASSLISFPTASNLIFSNMYLDGAGLNGGAAFEVPTTATTALLYNNLVWDFTNDGFQVYNPNAVVDNCGVLGGVNGFDCVNQATTIRSTWAFGATVDYNRAGSIVGNNCASSDATTDNFASGANNQKNLVTNDEIDETDTNATFGYPEEGSNIATGGNTTHSSATDGASNTWDGSDPSIGFIQFGGGAISGTIIPKIIHQMRLRRAA